MKVYFLGQGLENTEKTVGDLLIESFQDQEFNSFSCLVAFVSSSGIRGLSNHIEASKDHIEEFNVFVGIDQKATQKEALESLLSLDIGAKIYHTRSHIIFHPKIYVFDGGRRGRIILGSSNMTVPGLFQNIEASTVIDFEKPDEDAERLSNEIHDYFESLFNGESPNVQSISTELISELVEEGIVPDIQERTSSEGGLQEERETETAKHLRKVFPTVCVQTPSQQFSQRETTTEGGQEEAPLEASKGNLIWEKPELSASDAQDVSGGTHITGQLRFGQAGWEINGSTIDQTTYFRDDVFGDFDWKRKANDPNMEFTEVWFNIKISGEDLGYHKLEIRHKPEWEAEQRNVTTMLIWGDLIEEIKNRDLTGKRFRLYASEEDGNALFIEID